MADNFKEKDDPKSWVGFLHRNLLILIPSGFAFVLLTNFLGFTNIKLWDIEIKKGNPESTDTLSVPKPKETKLIILQDLETKLNQWIKGGSDDNQLKENIKSYFANKNKVFLLIGNKKFYSEDINNFLSNRDIIPQRENKEVIITENSLLDINNKISTLEISLKP